MINPLLESALKNALRSQKVTGVTSDSREVGPGSIFVAVRGGSQDGHQFIEQAAAAGAILIVGEDESEACSAPYYQVQDSREALSGIAALFHGNPSHGMLLIGVTGTSGKTTTTYVLESILAAAGKRVGVLGTVNFRYGNKIFPASHTTPGAVELQKLLSQMKDAGCDSVVMEVSSHALKQRRVAHVAFDGMIFNNLSREHLDFHPDMEDYFRSKAILFRESTHYAVASGKKPVGAINAEDLYGQRLLRDLDGGLEARAFSVPEGLSYGWDGIRGESEGLRVESGLFGRFNASNIMGALTLARALQLPDPAIERGIRDLQGLPGRLEVVKDPRQEIRVLVDYAHKPDALEKVLKTLGEIAPARSSRILTVFGCGGDRDRTKRPVMGRIACESSARVFITSDNPRTEEPEAIIAEIVRGAEGYSNYSVEPDRRKAIVAAISEAKPGDVVLIAGKGHEDYQIIAVPGGKGETRKIHFDDREVAAEALARPGQAPLE